MSEEKFHGRKEILRIPCAFEAKRVGFMHFLRSYHLLTSLLLTCYVCIEASPTQLDITPKEVHFKTEEILRAHIRFKEFDQIVAKRAFQNYLEELDPLKTYLVQEEIEIYLNPSDEFLKGVIVDYQNDRFDQFEALYQTMLNAIERRNSLEAKIPLYPLPIGVKAKEIHELGWAKDPDALLDRLLKIRALQEEASTKLASDEEHSLFFQRITKRRLNREKGLIGQTKQDQQKELLSYFLKSVSSALDSHTMYFTPSEARQFLIQVQQRLFGIGAQLRDDLNGLTVVRIMEGGPANREGSLKVGDKIIAVNHEAIIGLDISDSVEMIRGPQGSKVILTILRGEESKEQKFDLMITRDEVVITESRYETKIIPYGNGIIGYVALYSFYQDPKSSSTEDIRAAIESMKRDHNVVGVILDLRNNSGGLLPQAVGVTGLFIDKGVVASIKDCTGREQRLRNLSDDPVWKGPLIVVTNKMSASASEIVALSLKDYGRALVVGDEYSYGKGSYQTFTLESSNPDKVNPQGEYKVTRGAYYTVGGGSPQMVGVKASIEIPGIYSKLEIGEKYTKYPLSNDSIPPQFDDDLSDVNALYRLRLKKLLGGNIQKRSNALEKETPVLAKNSAARIKNNKNYLNFIQSMDEMDKYELDFSKVGQNDLQLEEATNVLKELIAMNALKKTSN
jgi:carboxyl-terminal processing protease